MRDIRKKLLTNEATTDRLRDKLMMCGAVTPAGYRNFCRSCGCDTCRRYKGRIIARQIEEWATNPYPWLLRKVRIELPDYASPSAMLDGIDDHRVKIRKCVDRHQHDDARWAGVMIQGVWRPTYDRKTGTWSAVLYAVAYLGKVGEIAILRALEPLLSLIRMAPITVDQIADHIAAGVSINGLTGCPADDLSHLYGALARRGEHRALAFRRGISR